MDEQADRQLDKQLLGLRVIVLALILGIVIFGIVTFVIGPRMPHKPELANILLLVMAAICLVEFPVYLLLRKITLTGLQNKLAEKDPDADAEAKVFPAWQNLTIIRSAMLEGVSLFALIITMLTGVKAPLIIPAVALILLAGAFPTRSRLEDLTSSLTANDQYPG